MIHQILWIKWQYRITNNEVLSRADVESLEAIITRHRLDGLDILLEWQTLTFPANPVLNLHLEKDHKVPQKYTTKTSSRLQYLEEDQNRHSHLGDGSCRNKSLKKDYSLKNSSFQEQQKAAGRDKES